MINVKNKQLIMTNSKGIEFDTFNFSFGIQRRIEFINEPFP